jgi:transposase-like protein
MGESMRCPFCGATGATRVESVCEYQTVPAPPGPPVRGRLIRQTDRFECEDCKKEWNEVIDPRAANAQGANA